MISSRACTLFLVAATTFSSVAAMANTTHGAPTARAVQPIEPLLVADVVVQGQQPAPAQAPAAPAAPVVQQQTVPAQAPVVETPTRHTVVEHETHNYMATVFVSALMGGLAGGLIGGAIYYLSDDQTHPVRIAYWAAGGVLVGTGVGIAQIMVQESRVDRATASRLPTDPAPTFRLALFQQRF